MYFYVFYFLQTQHPCQPLRNSLNIPFRVNHSVPNVQVTAFCRLREPSSLGRLAPMKKVNRCPHGGLRQVRTLLIKGEEITCAACQALFKKHNFEQERMEEVIAAVINGELIPKIKDEKKQSENPQIEDNQDEEKGEDQPDGEKGEARKKGSKAVEARRHQRVARLSEREQCMDYLHQYQGIIELLPTGSQGKRIPFRCLLCKTRSQPHGKVGELSAWKLSTVEYFLDKHLSCDTHQKNMRKAKNKGSEVVEKHLVPCEAVAINDSTTRLSSNCGLLSPTLMTMHRTHTSPREMCGMSVLRTARRKPSSARTWSGRSVGRA